MTKWKASPKAEANTKKPTIFSKTIQRLVLGSAILVTTVSAIMPKISSMIAAPKIAVPALVEILPISFKVSTEILTEVAVRIIPMKTYCKKVLAGRSLEPTLHA